MRDEGVNQGRAAVQDKPVLGPSIRIRRIASGMTVPRPGACVGLAISLMGCAGLLGCGSDVQDQSYETPSIDPEATAAVTIEGTFAYKQVLSQYVRQAFGDGYEHQLIIAYTFGNVTPLAQPSEYAWSDLICYVEMTDLSGSKLSLIDGYYQNPTTVPITLEIPDPTAGGAVQTDQVIELYGVNLDDPANDPLPLDPTDPRIYDFDYDGKAGFTVMVDGPAFGDGEIWAIQRYVYAMDGVVVSADEFSGLIDGYSENAYIYTSASYLPSESDAYPDTEPGHNYWQMIRVSNDYSCSQLMADKDSLFSI